YVVIKKTDCSLNYGDAYGLNLVYSGNHMELAEVSFTGKTRILNGINPHGFKWTLDVGETFYTPEATLCFSALGTNGLTQNYHYFVNNHIVRGEWQNKPRPILANNWEATSFNFTEKKILDIAKASKALGIELFVLDDGWFGKRTDDTKGLGDWEVNKSRLPHGIDGLANKINSMGMSFGLWVEPEMVNSNSDLYRAHPDWAVVHPDYKPCLGRNQLLLDLTNTDVQNYIIDSMTKVFSYGNISYIKWDYNRNMSDYYSATLGDRQGEFFHRYMLGFYRVVNTLVTRFPKILFESCASGGNRVDLGLLCYMPQFWASDNTDAHDRVLIQEGTLTCYPQSTIGSHVSASPNMQTLRNSFIENRFNTASIGLLGYELDLTELNKVDSNAVSEQIKFYKKYRDTLQYGTYYRIKSIFADNHGSYIIVNKDKSQAVAFLFNNVAETVPPADILRTVGLDNEAMYRFETREQVFNIKVFGNLINYVLPIKIKDEGFLQEVLNNNIAMKCEVQKYCVSGQLLNNAGVKLDMAYNSTGYSKDIRIMGDFGSRIYMIDRIDK
ncbi:MAG: alpha-galactosidase, partial [Clostridia bacterium]